MNERVIYLSDFKNSNKEELMNKSIDSIKRNEGNKFYYLLPNGELLKKYRKEIIRKSNGGFDVNVFTFDDVVSDILKKIEINEADETLQKILLANTIKDLNDKNKLSYYKDISDLEGFILSVRDIIREIKRSLVSTKEYMNKSPREDKFKEIGLIYNGYEQKLRENDLFDREGLYLKSIEILKDSNILDELDYIIIDEFYDFRPVELEILKMFTRKDIDIYINMPFKSEQRNIVLENTIKELIDLGFKTKEIKNSKNNTKYSLLAKNIFSDNNNIKKIDANITTIESVTPYLEIKKVFYQIKKKHSKGIDLNDIAIILVDQEYEDVIHQVAKEEEIPISLSKEIGLKHLPIIRELLNIINCVLSNGSNNTLKNRLNSYYFPIIENKYKNNIEENLKRLNITNIDDLYKILMEEKEIKMTSQEIVEINSFYKNLFNEKEFFFKKGKIKEYNNKIIEILNYYDVEKNIFNRFSDIKYEHLLLRDLKGLFKIKEILDTMNNSIISDYKISLEEYYFILNQYLEDEKILDVEGNSNGVHVINPVTARGLKKDTIFIVGLNQGLYPKLENNGYLINDYNLKHIKNIGMDINDYSYRLDNEILKFKSTISQVKNELYLSYITGNDNSKIPSMFWDEINNCVLNMKWINVELKDRIYYPYEYITTKKDLNHYLLKELSENHKINKNLYELDKKLNKNKLAEVIEKNLGENQRNNLMKNEYSGVIDSEEIKSKLKLEPQKPYSISLLEKYSNCPFAYFMEEVLQVKKVEVIEKYSPIDIGNLYHNVLERYYKLYCKDIKRSIHTGNKFEFSSTEDSLQGIITDEFNKIGFEKENKKDLLIYLNSYEKLKNYILEDLNRMSRFEYYPLTFEKKFGFKDDFKITYGGETVYIQGRIDRIDKFLEKEQYIVVDYKSSAYNIKNIDDIIMGSSFQLPVYILSQENKNIVAAGYGIISNKQMRYILGLVDKTSVITKRSKGGLEIEEWEKLMTKVKENIIYTVRGIEDGNYIINPVECSEYCDFIDICRYQEVLEVD